MKNLLILILAALVLPLRPTLSHGYKNDCAEECNDYYCPSDHLRENKKEVMKKIPSKK